MEPRLYPLAPDLIYVLDGALDESELTAGPCSALRLYGETEKIDAICNAKRRPGAGQFGFLKGRRAMCLELERYGWSIVDQLPERERGAFYAQSIASLRYYVGTHTEIFAAWRFEDYTTGGTMKPINRNSVSVRHDGSPTKKAARRLDAPSAMRRDLRDPDYNDGFMFQRRLFLELLKRVIDPRPYVGAAFDFQQLADRLDEQRDRQWAEFRAKQVRSLSRPQRRRQRKVIRRAAMLAASILGMSTVSAFASGQPVLIPTEEITFEFNRGSEASGHGAVDVRLLDGENHIANLCVYMNLPAMDQLAAFALHIEAGEADHLLETGNFWAVQNYEHPVITKREKRIDWMRASDRRRQLSDQHFQDNRDVYRREVFGFVFGRHARTLLEKTDG